MSDNESKLPKELTREDSDPTEDFRRMLEEIIEQNATILERLDEWDDDDSDEEVHQRQAVTPYQKPVIVQVFDKIISWETVFILLIIALLVVPLFRAALD